MFFCHRIVLPLAGVGLFQAGFCPAADESAGALEALRKQVLEMQGGIQRMQTQHDEEIGALKAKLEAQQKIIDDLQKKTSPGLAPLPEKPGENAPPPSSSPLFPTTDPAVVATPGPVPGAAAATLEFPTTDASVVGSSAQPAPAPGALTAPIPLIGGGSGGGGKSYLNISFDAVFVGAFSSASDLDRLEVGDHDPQQRGFNARNLEIALDGAVDPYFEGFANIVFKLDNHNETEVEAEEAFLQTTAMPWGLQFKGGQFFSPFGRINPTHPHTWDFVDTPLVNGRLLGPDGLRGVGVQASWVLPTPWYSQLAVAMQNGQGSTGYSFRNPGDDGVFYGRQTIDRDLRGFQDFVFAPRWENSFDLGPTQTVLLGVSGAFGPNDTGEHARTEIYGADLFYKWKPANAEGGWPFVKWQTEALWRRYDAGRGVDNSFPATETFRDWGAYSQVVWGFKKGWAAGLRGDYLAMDSSPVTDDPDRQSRSRLSADVTFYPSEFSKLRLQYNHDFLKADHFNAGRDADSVFLLFEFALGAHGAHKF